MKFAFSNWNARAIARAVALAATLALAAAPLLHAQDSAASTSTDAGKRKVKSRVAAEYPVLARQMGVTGKVKVEVTITARRQSQQRQSSRRQPGARFRRRRSRT